MGDGLKNFISRLLMLKRYLNFVGLEVFPSSGSTRRQVIHSLDFFVLLYQDKRTSINKGKELDLYIKWGKSSQLAQASLGHRSLDVVDRLCPRHICHLHLYHQLTLKL